MNRLRAWLLVPLLLAAPPSPAAAEGLLGRRLVDAAQPLFRGQLRVGRIDSDLQSVTLSRVDLDDAEGQVAIHADRVQLSLDPAALLTGTARIDRLFAQGVEVRARRLPAGEINLTELLAPGGGGGARLAVVIAHAVLDGRISWIGGQPFELALRVEGHGQIDAAGADLTIDKLEGISSQPFTATVSGKGRFRPGADGVGLELGVATDGTQLARALPEAHLRGAWRAALSGSGPLDRLPLTLRVTAPRGAIDASATVNLQADEPAWSDGKLRVTALDPAACWVGAPEGELAVEASGRGVGARGSIDVTRGRLDVTGVRLTAAGHVDLSGAMQGELDLVASDLARLTAFGVRGLAGQLRARGRVVRTGGRTRIDADFHGSDIGLGAARLKRLDGRIATVGLTGTVRIDGRDLSVGTLRFGTIAISGDGGRRTVELQLTADGATRVELHARGAPLGRPGEPTGVEGTVDQLQIVQGGRRWQSAQPALLRISAGEGRLHDLVLTSAGASMVVGGRWYGERLDATLALRAIDARALGELAGAGAPLPVTRLDGRAHLGGTFGAPALDLELHGESQPFAELTLPRLDHALHLRWEGGRARGDLTSDGASGGEVTHLRARFDLPTALAGSRPVTLELDGGGLPIPPALDPLHGRLALHARLAGTVEHPEGEVVLEAAGFRFGGLRGDSAALRLRYRGVTLTGEVAARFAGARRGGGLDGHLVLPVDLDLDLARRHGRRLLVDLPLEGAVAVRELDLSALPRVPLESGIAAGALRISGTLSQPRASGQLAARELALGPLDRATLWARVEYQRGRWSGSAGADRDEVALLRARGEAPLPAARLLDPAAWRDLPLQVDGAVPELDLAALRAELAGRLRGALTLRGSPAHPDARVTLSTASFRLGRSRFARCQSSARWDGIAATFELSADESGGGALGARGVVDSAGWRVSLDARRLALDLPSLRGGWAGSLAATVAGQIELRGGPGGRSARGRLRVEGGRLTLGERALEALPGTDALPYERLELSAVLDGSTLRLSELALTHAGGTLRGQASFALDGLELQRFEAQVVAAGLPLRLAPGGVWGAWVDADLALEGDLVARPKRFQATVRRGSARLPRIDLAQERSLQQVGPLADVVFVESARRAAFAPQRELPDAPAEPAANARLVALLPGPLRLRSPEAGASLSVDATLRGELSLERVGPEVTTGGAIEATSGRAKLFGRPYDLERARLTWGPAREFDPTLDLRATREIADATLVIEVGGSLAKPELKWFAEPPIYDPAQVERIIVSGDPGSDRGGGDPGAGALSALVARELKTLIAPQLALFDVVRATSSQELTLDPTGLEIGKYLTDRFYVSFVHQFTTLSGTRRANANQLQLEYRLGRHLLLQGLYGDAAVLAIDLFDTIRY